MRKIKKEIGHLNRKNSFDDTVSSDVFPSQQKVSSFEESQSYVKHAIYTNILLKSSSIVLSGGDSWLLSHFSILAQNFIEKGKIIGFSEEVLDCLKGHPILNDVERVCLSKIAGNSNEIVCLDSHNAKSVDENLLSSGYRCFVIPDGSLFNLSRITLRTTSSISELIDNCLNHNKPIPRTLGYLNAMKFESGICLPLFRHKKVVGFLFLNSRKKNFFTNIRSEHFPILCTLQMAANSVLGACTSYSTLDTSAVAFCTATSFDEKKYGKRLNVQFESMRLSIVVVRNSNANFMTILDNIIYTSSTIIDYLLRIYSCKKVEVYISKKSNFIIFSFIPLEYRSDIEKSFGQELYLNLVINEAKALGFTYRIVNSSIEIEFPFDPVLLDENKNPYFYSIYTEGKNN